jgi:hypothetical protein
MSMKLGILTVQFEKRSVLHEQISYQRRLAPVVQSIFQLTQELSIQCQNLFKVVEKNSEFRCYSSENLWTRACSGLSKESSLLDSRRSTAHRRKIDCLEILAGETSQESF